MDHFREAESNGKPISKECLKPVVPKALDDIEIKLQKGSAYGFKPYKKTDTKEELYEELAVLREKMKGFLADLTPVFEKTEDEIQLTRFRYSLNGEEQGEVSIPHYGGPVGKQTAVYEKEVCLDKIPDDKRMFICFEGVDYLAEVYVNESFAGVHEGFFAPFEFDITEKVKAGKNSIRIIVRNDFVMKGNHLEGQGEYIPANGDKIFAATGPGWDDHKLGWHHCPPGFGIYNKVYLQIRNEEYITDIFPRINSRASEIWVECFGTEPRQKDVKFSVSVYGQNFKETVFENLEIVPRFSQYPEYDEKYAHIADELKIENGYNRFLLPVEIRDRKLWDIQTPYLYQVRVEMIVEGKTVSRKKCQFGIRDFVQDEGSLPKGGFYLNGKKIKLFGANTMGFEQQDVMRGDYAQLIDDILLAKLCNMNFWRITQRPVQKEVYEYCDRLGLMIQTDMPAFACIRINQYCEFLRQAQEMEKLIRSHPCCVLVSYINEPNGWRQGKPHRMLDKREMTALFDAADTVVRLNDPDRVIKHVDGDDDPPRKGMTDRHCYTFWYSGHMIPAGKLWRGYWCDSREGWYTGCGEFGAEGLDFPEIMRKYYPANWIEEPFNPKNITGAQTWEQHHLFYETPSGMDNWVRESQRHQAFAVKMTASSFRRNEIMNTFAVHLFIDAFPSGWMKAIMDFKRAPKPAYFAYRDCLSPVFCSLRSDRFTFFEEENIRIESYLNIEKGNADTVKYMAEYEGKCIYSAEKTAEKDIFQGYVTFKLPSVNKRGKIKVYMGAFEKGELKHFACEEYGVFPQNGIKLPETVSYEEYNRKRNEYDSLIKEGKRIVLDHLPVGEYEIAGRIVKITGAGGDTNAVSRDTGHPLVAEFLPNDFSWLYDEKEDRIMPTADTAAECDDAEMILKTGEKGIVTGEIKFGKGGVIVNQLLYKNKMKNPVVSKFIKKLSEYIV